ncbi:MAG: hypothetical protein Q8O99_00055 [bacterium]|nr:hypothetical protein [bacterium]
MICVPVSVAVLLSATTDQLVAATSPVSANAGVPAVTKRTIAYTPTVASAYRAVFLIVV